MNCRKCGGVKDPRAAVCRTCWTGTIPKRRRCTKCGKRKAIRAFRIRTRATSKPRSWCRSCEALDRKRRDAAKPPGEAKRATREWERRNPERHRQQIQRRRCRIIGLPEEQIPAIVERMNRTTHCEICGQQLSSAPGCRLTIDHCHRTGRFRGLICESCNHGLGKFRDDPAVIAAALRYIRQHQ